jgi:ornithine carbamoyltransferase
MPRFGLDVTLIHPPEFKLMPDILEAAKEQARKYHAAFEVITDPDGMEKGFKDADIVYAKSWGAMLTTEDAAEGSKIIGKYQHWITDTRKMRTAKADAIYMHPLPADRDIEVTSEVMDGPNSVVFDQAENRLHAQKAVMALTMS